MPGPHPALGASRVIPRALVWMLQRRGAPSCHQHPSSRVGGSGEVALTPGVNVDRVLAAPALNPASRGSYLQIPRFGDGGGSPGATSFLSKGMGQEEMLPPLLAVGVTVRTQRTVQGAGKFPWCRSRQQKEDSDGSQPAPSEGESTSRAWGWRFPREESLLPAPVVPAESIGEAAEEQGGSQAACTREELLAEPSCSQAGGGKVANCIQASRSLRFCCYFLLSCSSRECSGGQRGQQAGDDSAQGLGAGYSAGAAMSAPGRELPHQG